MKASELNGTHLGERMTVTIGEASVTDTLVGVEHRRESVLDLQISEESSFTLGAKHTELTFRAAGTVRTKGDAQVEIHGDTPAQGPSATKPAA